MEIRTRVGAVVAGAAAAGLATLAVAVPLAWSGGLGPPAKVGAFAVLLALSWAFPLLVLRRDETEAFQLDEAFFVVMALLLAPLGAIVAFAAAAAASQLARRRPPARTLFNVGQITTASGLGLAAAHLLSPMGGGVGPGDLAAAVAGAAVFMAANAAFVSAVIAVTEERSFVRAFLDGVGFRLLVWAASVAIGLLAGLAGAAYSWALLLAALPAGVLQVVLAGSLRARRDRERLDGLFRAAVEAHASMRLDDVEEAIAGSASRLLQTRTARIAATPPSPGELGCPLPGGESTAGRWLLVADRRAVGPFGPQDARLLEAIAAVGSSALENAHLLDRIRHQAFHDSLTGLPNQVLFEDRVGYALAQASRTHDQLAVLCLDLDEFKKVNDGLGHPAGNELLRQAADRLATLVRSGDTVARMGGDEFMLLLTGLARPDDAVLVAQKILDGFRRPFTVAGHQLFVTPSIGIAGYPEDGLWPAELLKNADSAMYRAKQRGRNGYQVYASAMNAGAGERLALEAGLHRALEDDQLRLVYQPQVELRSGRVVGVEALVRWPHPELGMVGPDRFIPLAEQTGLIVALDGWVLRTACAQAKAWERAGLPPLRIAVNVSGETFQRPGLLDTVGGALAASGLNPARLELEVTESVAVGEEGESLEAIRHLRRLGVGVAVDDFGTGYSTLSHLQRFPLDRLKIDRSFVQAIERPDDEAPIVAAVIAMAHALKLEVTAEGVETPEQQAFLAGHACDEAQGYLLSRPLEPQALERLLRQEPVGTFS